MNDDTPNYLSSPEIRSLDALLNSLQKWWDDSVISLGKIYVYDCNGEQIGYVDFNSDTDDYVFYIEPEVHDGFGKVRIDPKPEGVLD